MRIVEFQEVGMENFGPYIDPMVLPFKNNSLTLMTGPNGIGKTMSLDAIPFTLYGITTKKAKGDDVVNNAIGKNCKTYVKFKVNEDQYIVTRYHKYTQLGNTVIINKNGVDTKKGQKEVLPEMERVLCPQKAFMNTLMFGQKVKDFFTDLVDSDKKEIFRKILNLEKYQIYYKETDNKLKVATKALQDMENELQVNMRLLKDATEQIALLTLAKTEFYKTIENDIAEYKKSLQENDRLLKQWQEQLGLLKIEDVTKIDKKLNEISSNLQSLDTKYGIMYSELDKQKNMKISEIKEQAFKADSEIKNKYSDEKEKLNSLKLEKLDELTSIKENLKEQLHSLEIQIGANNQRIIGIEGRINEIKVGVLDAEISTCPTCEQDVTAKTIQLLGEKVSRYQNQIAEHKNDITKTQQSINTMKQNFDKEEKLIQERIKIINGQIEETRNNQDQESKSLLERLQTAIHQVEKMASNQIKDYNQRAATEKQSLTANKLELESKKKSIEKEQQKVNEINETILKINQQMKTINDRIKFSEEKEYDETQLNSYTKKEGELEHSIHQFTESIKMITDDILVLQFWKVAYSPSGIPSMLIDESIPFMNKKVSHYLDLLTNGRYIVSFDTMDEIKSGEFRDKISVRVIDTHTQANSRVQLSGGQTRIVDIATILTLGDLQSNINDVKFNILLFDEIFDALDDENIGYVSKILNKLKMDRSIYIISHQHQDQLEPDELLAFA